ncbi:unnamed protein product [Cuscuta campestris]|uniref:ALBINO3-like protein 2, chloroplastic n=2 Tax=Cuscuta sect. Cleistogrammica TaxID=1824901 RepID=A0A484KUB4_9ASTE|nr:unnamed protein product [Cuscuta campestris]
MARRYFVIGKPLFGRSHSLLASYSLTRSHFSGHRLWHHCLLQSVPSTSSFSRSKNFLFPLGFNSFSSSFSTRGSISIQDEGFRAAESAVPADLILQGDVVGGRTLIESILPVSALVSLLDGCQSLTGFPWWFIIASGTLATRLTLFPFVVLQLRKLSKIGEMLPKLPPPFPRPQSGRTFKDQFELFCKEKRAAGCPSLLWFISSFSLQVPCFLLWLTTMRRMSLDHHNGFECGGILWFQNLTEVPNGALGPILPILISGLHFINVQVSFRDLSVTKVNGTFALLSKYYKMYLEILAVPILFISFNLPHGNAVYWLCNSSLTLLQQVSLRHPYVRKILKLPDKDVSVRAAIPKKEDCDDTQVMDTSTETQEISAESLSAQELVNIATKFFADGKKDVARQLMQLALDKNPDYARALILSRNKQMDGGLSSDTQELLQSCISDLLLNAKPVEAEDANHLILSSQWAGVACIQQGKHEEGIAHLEKVALMKEPEDPNAKSHYYDALLMYSGALYTVGRKAEAAKYLRIICAYDPSCISFLKKCESDEYDETARESNQNEIVNDLDKRQRAD